MGYVFSLLGVYKKNIETYRPSQNLIVWVVVTLQNMLNSYYSSLVFEVNDKQAFEIDIFCMCIPTLIPEFMQTFFF